MSKPPYLFLLILCLVSCKEEIPPMCSIATIETLCDGDGDFVFTSEEMFTCDLINDRDFVEIEQVLVGVWELGYTSCYWTPESGTCHEKGAFTVEFKMDHTYEVWEDGAASGEGNWKIDFGNEVMFIDLDPARLKVAGLIYLCEDQVTFNESYLDLCDSYYKRR